MLQKYGRKLCWLGAALAAVVLAAAFAVGTALAGTVFNWRGEGQSASVANLENWVADDPQRDVPGDEASDDRVVIADDSARRQVVIDGGTLTVASLKLGDGHEVVLDDDVEIVGDESGHGRLEFEGEVTISGDGQIIADGVYVNSKVKTTITVGETAIVATREPEQEE